MTQNRKMRNRIISIFLSIMLIMACVPGLTPSAAPIVDTLPTKSDTSTLDGWQEFFPMGDNINTENAGGIWTDKTVLNNEQYNALVASGELNPSMPAPDQNGFTVALSAMGSNMTVTGLSTVPTDTMLVLDVSGSMDGSESALVSSANSTIKQLLGSNKFNRVGIILYSGPGDFGSSTGQNDAVTLLPLGRYTSSRYDGNFVRFNNNTVSLYTGVVIEGTSRRPSTTSKSVNGGTYMQTGINLARKQMTAETLDTVVTDPTIGTVKRKPIVVLMSDGAPTLATTNFADPTNSNMGNGGSSDAAIGFATQLSIAYAKNQIEEKYQTSALVYTLSVGLTTQTTGYDVARAVLNPINTYNNTFANAMDSLWSEYIAAANGSTIYINDDDNYVTKLQLSTPLAQNYVTGYFAASNSSDMLDAFQKIVDDIALQSKYFPTLIEENENLSGYITFTDKIGKYMEVTAISGIRLHQTTFSGADLASNFVPGGGNLGTTANPTALGDEMVWAVMARLGVDSSDIARTLISLAYQNGQLAYNSLSGEFSNYIGWFADAGGKYAGFWHENMNESSYPSNAAYIMKSYGYLGETDTFTGVEKSDMMYVTVQLREDIATGEQTVTFSVPAALIPTVTYEVSLNEQGALSDLKATGATAPIRLVYKVSLRKDINSFNIGEIVDTNYFDANSGQGGVDFYTNQYEVDGATGYRDDGTLTSNTFSYFRPSRQNDRYYYQQDSQIFSSPGVLYHGEKPYDNPNVTGDEFYHGYTVYYKNGRNLSEETKYHVLTSEAVDTAHSVTGSDTWIIPEGDVRRDYAGYQKLKADNNTGTLPFSGAPFTDMNGHGVNDTGHYFVVGATLGNNGKITMSAETGIKITKALNNATSDESFSFTVSGAAAGLHDAQKLLADGSIDQSLTQVLFNENGETTVTLKAGEILYIGDMTAGQSITVSENFNPEFMTESVNGDKSNTVTLTTTENKMVAANFVNTARGEGNLTVAKEVEHPLGADYTVPTTQTFDIRVKLTLDEKPLTGSFNDGGFVTDSFGEEVITLVHGQQYEIKGIPAGTVATVTEENYKDFFTPSYFDNGEIGDGEVKIENGRTSSVIVVNSYAPKEVFPVNIKLGGTKTLEGRDEWIATDIYKFTLEQYDFALQDWVQLESLTVNAENHSFSFNDIFSNKNFKYEKAGNYYYRVKEEVGSVAGVTYDTALHSFRVVVGDKSTDGVNMDGQLEILSVTETATGNEIVPVEGVYNLTANFTNSYVPGETTASITVSKKAINNSLSTAMSLEGFRFRLYEVSGGTVGAAIGEPAVTTVSGTARINLPTYTAEGTYRYAVKELNDGDEHWKYSADTVFVTVEVTDNGEELVARAYVDTEAGIAPDEIPADATSAVEISFTNEYIPTPAELTVDFVNKILSGRDYNAGEFSFRLVERDNAGNIVAGSEKIGTNGAPDTNGISKVNFAKLTFNKVGTYFFDITEIEPEETKGVTYDKNVARLTVSVTDNGGTLAAAASLVNLEGNTITFNNSYKAAPAKVVLRGTKALAGRALLNGEFRFKAEEVYEDGTPKGKSVIFAENGEPVARTNTAPVVFPEIEIGQAGTYYFAVTEVEPENGLGVKFDKALYTAKVVVADNGNGLLEATSITYNGQENVTFNNSYIAEPTAAVIEGQKYLDGRDLAAGEFSFSLYSANAEWLEGELLEAVTNKLDGSFAFSEIGYTSAGTYYYLVKEDEGSLGGVSYDNTVYRVRVEVKDNLMGALSSSVFVNSERDVPLSEVAFNNTYTVTGKATVTFGGTKELKGKELTDNMFGFNLNIADSSFNAGDLLETVKNIDGKFSFTLEYGVEDIGNTYYYVVSEENRGKNIDNIAYSNNEYHITVLVYDDNNGNVATKTVITLGEKEVSALDFVNVYDELPPPPPDSPKTGDYFNLTMWLAVLFVSGGIGTLVIRKKLEEN